MKVEIGDIEIGDRVYIKCDNQNYYTDIHIIGMGTIVEIESRYVDRCLIDVNMDDDIYNCYFDERLNICTPDVLFKLDSEVFIGVRATRLAKKMYPDAIEEKGLLYGIF